MSFPPPDRTKIVSLRLTPDEHRRFSAAAKARGLALGTWLRMLALDATAEQAAVSRQGGNYVVP
jgi:predicted HicB family RNase H-like nuclease